MISPNAEESSDRACKSGGNIQPAYPGVVALIGGVAWRGHILVIMSLVKELSTEAVISTW